MPDPSIPAEQMLAVTTDYVPNTGTGSQPQALQSVVATPRVNQPQAQQSVVATPRATSPKADQSVVTTPRGGHSKADQSVVATHRGGHPKADQSAVVSHRGGHPKADQSVVADHRSGHHADHGSSTHDTGATHHSSHSTADTTTHGSGHTATHHSTHGSTTKSTGGTGGGMTLSEFKVDLADLNDATDVVAAQAKAIRTYSQEITARMQGVERVWQGPAGSAFVQLQVATSKDMDGLNTILDEMVTRMRIAYQNYRDIEQRNLNNLKDGHHVGQG